MPNALCNVVGNRSSEQERGGRRGSPEPAEERLQMYFGVEGIEIRGIIVILHGFLLKTSIIIDRVSYTKIQITIDL